MDSVVRMPFRFPLSLITSACESAVGKGVGSTRQILLGPLQTRRLANIKPAGGRTMRDWLPTTSFRSRPRMRPLEQELVICGVGSTNAGGSCSSRRGCGIVVVAVAVAVVVAVVVVSVFLYVSEGGSIHATHGLVFSRRIRSSNSKDDNIRTIKYKRLKHQRNQKQKHHRSF